LDPQKLAARGMSAGDVANAIRSQNLQAAAGQIGQPPVASGQTLQLPLDTLGRLADPEQFGNIIVKVGPNPPPPPALRPMPAPTVSVSSGAAKKGANAATKSFALPMIGGVSATGDMVTGGAGSTNDASATNGATPSDGTANPAAGSAATPGILKL